MDNIFVENEILSLEDIVKSGLNNVKQFVPKFDKRLLNRISYYAVKNGKLEVLKWCFENNLHINSDSINIAAEYGSLEILEWLLSQNYCLNEYTCASAAYGGQLETLKWLNSRIDSFNMYEFAVMGGNLEVLEYLKSLNSSVFNSESLISVAKEEGKLEVIEWLLFNQMKN